MDATLSESAGIADSVSIELIPMTVSVSVTESVSEVESPYVTSY
jgi:hypothetical protein